jgi:hypothetical protein
MATCELFNHCENCRNKLEVEFFITLSSFLGFGLICTSVVATAV